ncbi:MAG: hypothetical protein FWG30_09195 [Eubacteriaceae bacterium]|nr:hypothetical protein [Eubacteriaceae bacterium]
MSLTRLELKKMLTSPITAVSIVAVIALNAYMLLFGSQDPSLCATGAYRSPFQTDIARLQQEGAYFAGEITTEWHQKYNAEVKAMRNDCANLVPDAEKERIRREDYREFTDEAIAELGNIIYLKESVWSSPVYQKYEDMEVSSRFHQAASKTGAVIAQDYRDRYPGLKGETLAQKAEEMYARMSHGYTARYNYKYGYEKLRIMHTTYPLTIGLIILVALSPLFSSEYSAKTDALILASKHGKKRLIYSKLKAGFIFAALSWAAIQIFNVCVIFGIYATTGAEAYWQDWMMFWAPFPFNQMQITIVTVATSFLGAVFFAGVVIIISAYSKNPFISLLIGGIMLFAPTFSFAFANSAAFQTIYNFLPTRVLSAVGEWQALELVYLLGKAVPMQFLVIALAVLAVAASIFISFFAFSRHQVEN